MGELALEEDDSLSVPTESLLDRKLGRRGILLLLLTSGEEELAVVTR